MADVPKMRQLFQHKDGAVWGLGEDGQVYEMLKATTDGTIPRHYFVWKRLPFKALDDQ